MVARPVLRVTKSRSTLEGAGVRLHRAIGFDAPELHDPFLLLDHFRSDNPKDYELGFPWHPHRGMETITYILQGSVEHSDNLGFRDVIGVGDVQWMSAGSGIVHQEMPRGDSAHAMHGFQLWANLPKVRKMAVPQYRGIRSSEIPEVQEPGGGFIKVVAGTVLGVEGPVRDVAGAPEYLDVRLPAGTIFTHTVPRGRSVFAYVFEGDGLFDGHTGTPARDRDLVAFGDGDSLSSQAGPHGIRFLLVSGTPIGEPIAWQGPIVMNSAEELRTAFDELERGTFIKHGKPR